MTNKFHTKIKNIVCDPAGIDFKKLTRAIQNSLYDIAKTTEGEDFFHAFAGYLIEYQGKRYVCLSETDYLPNERAEDWKECDYSSPEYKHTKIKFRDLFAKRKASEVERALEERS